MSGFSPDRLAPNMALRRLFDHDAYKIFRSILTHTIALMAAHHVLIFLSLLFLTTAATPPPRALVIPISKDAATLQYLAHVKNRVPLVPTKLTLDLGGRFIWVDCDSGYRSSAYLPIHCGSPECLLAKSDGCSDCYSSPRPGCNNHTCGLTPYNSVTRISSPGELACDTLSFSSTDGFNPGAAVTPPYILFSSAPTSLLQGLAAGTAGIAGLGRNPIGLPSQLAAAFGFARQFAICLPSSTRSDVKGVAFFGPGPYNLLPNTDASQSLIYTPLIINPVSTAGTYQKGEKSVEYFIKVTSIKVNNKPINVDQSLLLINKKGYGGTKISTVAPYTVLQTSIYTALTSAFVTALATVKRVKAVSPFEVCYNGKDLGSTRVGVAVPAIDLVLQKESVYWRIFGANSMVEVSDEVLCLGFLDGGKNPETSIVIGGHQIEDNLLQFDLGKSVLGFSSSLLFRQTTCANFNFTSTA